MPLKLGCFVLAKNERENIARTLGVLEGLGIETTVLDSHSTDDTASLASAFRNVSVVPYDYRSHCQAYNEITTSMARRYDVVMILDADMLVSEGFAQRG